MIRVVLDTNVLVSALLRSEGLPNAALTLLLSGDGIELWACAEIFVEYEEVLRRPRLKLSDEKISKTLSEIRAVVQMAILEEILPVASDPDDDVFLACAKEAGAKFLVTGNTRDFPERYASCEIVTAREFVELELARRIGSQRS